MPLPSELTITLPPSISSSFWTYPDYRPGVNSLYLRLQSGLEENQTILSLIQHRVDLEYSHAEALSTPAPIKSLSNPLLSISHKEQHQSNASSKEIPSGRFLKIIHNETTLNHSNAHNSVASNLEKNILLPFGKWSEQHDSRIRSSWEHVDAALTRFNRQKQEVERLRSTYESKCRQADEAEDDARFAPSSNDFEGPPTPEKPSQHKSSFQSEPQSMEEEKKDSSSSPQSPEALKRRETLRQQFGFNNKGRKSAPEASSSSRSELGGVSLPNNSSDSHSESTMSSFPSSSSTSGLSRSTTISSYLSSTINRLNENPALAPIRGALGALNEPKHLRIRREAENCEKGYKEAVKGLDGNRCRLEEILMEHFNLAGKWEGDREKAVKSVLDSYQAAFVPLLPTLSNSLSRSHSILSQFNPDLEVNKLISDFKTSYSYRPRVEVFHSYYHDSTDLNSLSGSGHYGFGMNLGIFNRSEGFAREELEEAEGKIGKKSNTSTTSESLSIPLILNSLLKSLEKSYGDSSRWPLPSGGENVNSTLLFASSEKRKAWIYDVPLTSSHKLREEIISLFENHSESGISGQNSKIELEKLLEKFDPPVLAATVKLWALELDQSLILENLWDQIESVYKASYNQERDGFRKLLEEKNKALKEKEKEISEEIKGDETITEELKDGSKEKVGDEVDVKEKGKGKSNADQKELRLDDALIKKIKDETLEDLKVVLGKLPKIHLICLDALIGHLSKLIKDTPTDEADVRYLNKLGLSLGRAIIRPPFETARTVSSKSPALLTMDLVSNYDSIFPALISKKVAESESLNNSIRKMPIRKRTKPIDQRVSRSQMAKQHAETQANYKALRQAQDQTLGAGNGIPIIPEDEKKIENDKPITAPIITTQTSSTVHPATSSSSNINDQELPTPLSTRVLGGGLGSNTEIEDSANRLSIERTASPAAQSIGGDSSTYGSARGDSSPSVLSPEIKPTSPSPSSTIKSIPIDSTTISSSNPSITTSASTEQFDQDKPLSNVARLSRQFGSSSSGGVRGPRPAGGREGRAIASEIGNESGNKRESKDLRPDADLQDQLNPDRQRRRRSWSRSVEPSDALVDGNEGSEG